jgi:predicted nucleotidyltransferase
MDDSKPDNVQNLHPTAHQEVNGVLAYFLKEVKNVLKGNFVGMYLYGSLALGDFDAKHSDIDFIVITESEIIGNHFNTFHNLYEAF